jgi:hypothetical protein
MKITAPASYEAQLIAFPSRRIRRMLNHLVHSQAPIRTYLVLRKGSIRRPNELLIVRRFRQQDTMKILLKGCGIEG